MYSPAKAPNPALAIAMPADPGETLFLAGDPCEHVYELRQGIVRGVSILADGERQISAFFFAGDQIGLPVSDCYRFTAEAVTNVLYVRHSRLRWHEALIRSCNEEGRLLPSICAEQDPIFRRGIIIGRNSVLVRICAFLVSMIDRLPEVDGALFFPLPQVDIAAYLATAPESVCRGFRQLREMGVIAMPRRDRLVIKDRIWLETIASGVVG
jgi:CRP-like cAMP-binding protein